MVDHVSEDRLREGENNPPDGPTNNWRNKLLK